eukprot:656866-Amphidinium_carterae.1
MSRPKSNSFQFFLRPRRGSDGVPFRRACSRSRSCGGGVVGSAVGSPLRGKGARAENQSDEGRAVVASWSEVIASDIGRAATGGVTLEEWQLVEWQVGVTLVEWRIGVQMKGLEWHLCARMPLAEGRIRE